MKNFLTYGVNDFILDESFQQWVLEDNPEATAFWTQWVVKHPHKQEDVEHARQLLLALHQEKDVASQEAQSEVWAKINSSAPRTGSDHRARQASYRPWYYIAASVILLLVAGFAYWTIRQQEQTTRIATAYGQTQRLSLPDGSKVYLNSNSSISFDNNWDDSDHHREVWLTGEGYFDVIHQNGRKFVVHTQQAAIEVLGTSFSVSERRNNTEVVLASGKVALHLDDDKIMMNPGEQVSFDKQKNTLEKQIVNPDLLTSWRNNQLIFEATPLSEIAQLLEDNYGYRVSIATDSVGSLLFSGTIQADQIDLLLEALAETHRIDIINENETIIFKEQ